MLLDSSAFRRLCRARDLLQDDLSKNAPIPAIARECGMSPYHFIRRFDQVFGTTPHQFRMNARLYRARLLLAKGSASVTEVCMEVGFESLGSFSSLFARRHGISPLAYQRIARTLVQFPGTIPAKLFPGCLSLMGSLPASAFRNFEEARSTPLR